MKSKHYLLAAAAAALAAPAGAATFTYTGPGGAILDNQTTPSPVAVIDNFTVVDVNVFVDGLVHSFPRDVQMFLEHGGVSIRLINNDGPNSNGSFGGTLGFDDEATLPISQYQSGTVGPYIPTDLLSAFDGQGSLGAWTLRVADVAGGGQGSFSGWRLVLDDGQSAAGVPEPASWAMMLAGFGLAGGALRRRGTRAVFAA